MTRSRSESAATEDAKLDAALHRNAASQLADMVIDSLPAEGELALLRRAKAWLDIAADSGIDAKDEAGLPTVNAEQCAALSVEIDAALRNAVTQSDKECSPFELGKALADKLGTESAARLTVEQILDDHAEISISAWDAKYGADCSLATAIRNALGKAPSVQGVIETLRAKNGKRSCDCTSCDCANSGDTYSVGAWDGADWVLNEIEKAIK